ncbi:MAG TPA: hypothetical protein PLB19_00865 [Candidatus Paceibacterota bacterium]|nr:hypothetical protein [Candidatus Paceibacterota bacterium]HRR45880.1 hypothetical protein [Candidatus Paceibacterota bacterium]
MKEMSWWLILIMVGGLIAIAGFLFLLAIAKWCKIVMSINPFFLDDSREVNSQEDSEGVNN